MFDRPELNNPHFNDCYFSYDEGVEEALYVFIDGNGLPGEFSQSVPVAIGETGFGTGLNLMALLSVISSDKRPESVHFISVEKFPLDKKRIIELLGTAYKKVSQEADFVIALWEKIYKNAETGWVEGKSTFKGLEVRLQVYIGDIQEYLQCLPCKIDHWFLDGHSPDKNPDMWSPEVMAGVAQGSHENTTLASFTAAGKVKTALRENGFFIKRRKGFGGKRHMIQGYMGEEKGNDASQ